MWTGAETIGKHIILSGGLKIHELLIMYDEPKPDWSIDWNRKDNNDILGLH